MRGRSFICAAAIAAALVCAGAASADHPVAVFPQPPTLAMLYPVSDAPPGFYAYMLIFSASWAPEASRYEGTLTMNDVTDGVEDKAGFYDNGAFLRTFDTLRTDWTGIGGHMYTFQTHWTVYGRNSQWDYGYGVGDSPPTILTPPVIAKPIFGDDLQKALREVSGRGFGSMDALLSIVNQLGKESFVAAGGPAAARLASVVGGTVTVESAAIQAAALAVHDPRYRRVTKVAAPSAPKVIPGRGLTAAQAAAANAYLVTATSATAYARALGTTIDRWSAARDAKKRGLRRLQAKAAARSALQLSRLLALQATRAARLRAAFGSALLGTATPDQIAAFQAAVAADKYPAETQAVFQALRATKPERDAIRGGLLAVDPAHLAGDGLDELTSPAARSELTQAAGLLRSFAKHAR